MEDIERIRKDLGVDRWEAIIGHSYGTVVAQQYAATYGRGGIKNFKGTDRVKNLILEAPLSRENALTATGARELADKIRAKHVEVFKKLYEKRFDHPESSDSGVRSADIKANGFTEELGSLLLKVDDKFGDLQFVIDEFSRLKNDFSRDLLKLFDLNYTRGFFRALRNLRNDWVV